MELVIVRNPDPDSRSPFLLRVPLDGGPVFRVGGTWSRTSAIYCYPVGREEWPTVPDEVERLTRRSCARRGAAIDLIVDRPRENRSQLVFTTARWRDVPCRSATTPSRRTVPVAAAVERKTVADRGRRYRSAMTHPRDGPGGVGALRRSVKARRVRSDVARPSADRGRKFTVGQRGPAQVSYDVRPGAASWRRILENRRASM